MCIRDSISAGDFYQVNLTQRLHLPLTAHPWVYYQRLRQVNPAPFAAYFALPHAGGAILSASPERFLRAVSYTHLRAHETVLALVCRLLLEKENQKQ